MRIAQALGGIPLVVILFSCGRPLSPTIPSSTQQVETSDSASTTLDRSSLDRDAGWLIYTHELGVSIKYPVDWSSEFTADGAIFLSPDGSRILWEIYPRPVSERASTDPNTWVPNQGGYEIHWSKSISIPDAEGLEFIWGTQLGNSWGVAPQLMAILYSEDAELDVRLSTFFDIEAIATLEEEGPDPTISKHFEEFEQMLQSVQIVLE
jgi:hypothetical protein